MGVKIMKIIGMMVIMAAMGDDIEDIPAHPAINNPSMDNWISKLYKDKMENYNKEARPVANHEHKTTVTIGLSLNSVDVNDERHELLVNAWTIMAWQDEFLQWVPEDYENLDRIHFDDTDIWLPDITLYNSADGSKARPFGDVPVLVEHTGKAYWFPPTLIAVKCDLDLTKWPKDEHECVVRMGSWAHHGEQIDLQIVQKNGTHGVMTETLKENSRWKLLNATAIRAVTSVEGHDPYVEVNFKFKVQRQARTHATYITQSTLAVVVVVLSSYLLPLHRFLSRLLMHLFSLSVLITCFFTLFALLPVSGGSIPIVVRYYSGSIILTTLSLFATLLLYTRCCGCCCRGTSNSSSSSTTSSSGFRKTLASFVTSPSRFRSAMTPQGSSASQGRTPYSHFENEITMEEEIEDRETRPSQLNQADGTTPGTSRYIRLQEDEAAGAGGGEEGKVDAVTSRQLMTVLNYLMLTLFTVAFVVDYIALRNVMM